MKTEALVDEALQLLSDGIDGTAIIACSGGIDSTVAAVLAHRAVGDLLHCVYVDTGLMRLGESDEVREMFDEMGIEIKVVDASKRFFDCLDGMSARYSPIPHEVLSQISTEITNTLKGQVNRVVYDITHKPPGTIEWE